MAAAIVRAAPPAMWRLRRSGTASSVIPDDVLTSFVAADAEFHAVLARAAANSMLNDLLDVTRTLLRVYNDRAVHHPEDMRLAGEEHAAILAALEQADGDRAASAMVAHMETARSRLLRAARAEGIDVPGELSVIGIDDEPMAAYLDPPLTTVSLDIVSYSRGIFDAAQAIIEAGPGEDPAVPLPGPAHAVLVERETAAPIRTS